MRSEERPARDAASHWRAWTSIARSPTPIVGLLTELFPGTRECVPRGALVSGDRHDGATRQASAEVVADLLRCAPGALAAIKRLPVMVQGDPAAARAATMDLLVERLASDEGQEGLRAFLEKRPPAWVPEWLKAR